LVGAHGHAVGGDENHRPVIAPQREAGTDAADGDRRAADVVDQRGGAGGRADAREHRRLGEQCDRRRADVDGADVSGCSNDDGIGIQVGSGLQDRAERDGDLPMTRRRRLAPDLDRDVEPGVDGERAMSSNETQPLRPSEMPEGELA